MTRYLAVMILAAGSLLMTNAVAHAQVRIDNQGQGSQAATSAPTTGGDVRAPSPRVLDPQRNSFFQFGAGPAYGIGFQSDSLMYNVLASYNWNYDNTFTLKALADLYMGAGSVSSRLYNLGVGADVYLSDLDTDYGTPYFSGELALGAGRNALEETAVGATVGAGAGFKFRAEDMNWDVNVAYSLLTTTISGVNPSTLGLRAAVNF